jgi:lysozyme family protein
VIGEMTLTANGKNVHSEEVRALTVEELQRRHSYGD